MKIRAIILLFTLLGSGFCGADVLIHEHADGMTIDSLYGRYEVADPVLIALIKSPMMQRLKKIRQYGVSHYAESTPDYTRFEHSVRVMLLSRQFGASLGEQIAALLHDVSHTAFSHVADYVFKDGDGKTSFQDDMHEAFIAKTGIDTLLAEYGYRGICSDEHKHAFRILEQDLPDLCTDRIEYLCNGGYIENRLTQQQVDAIVRDLRFEDGRWFFVNRDSALLLGNTSLQLTEYTFGSRQNFFVYRQAANALKRAMEIGLCTVNDICFSHDDEIWNRLCTSDDASLCYAVDCVLDCDKHCIDGTPDAYDMKVIGKFRGVNPWVKMETGFMRLTELDPLYAQEYERVRRFITNGCYIKYVH